MTPMAAITIDLLWRNALGAIPLAVAVALICRFIRCRPSTRHALWFVVLLALLAPPLLPSLDFSDDLGAPQFFATLAKSRENARSMTTDSGDPAAAMPLVSPGSREGADANVVEPNLNASTSSTQSARTVTSDTPRPSPNQTPAVRQEITAPQLPMLEIAASTASERSPIVLRPSASHPNSSIITQDTNESWEDGVGTSEVIQSNNAPVKSPLAASSADAEPSVAAIRPLQRWLPRFDDRSRQTQPMVGLQPSEVDAESGIAAPTSLSTGLATPTGGTFAFDTSEVTIEWRAWISRLVAARDAIVMLAPIPASLWIGGIVLIVLVMLVRVWRFRRLLGAAWPAERDAVDLVRACAESIGLHAMPRVLMTDRPLSPLVWCGLSRVLLLPLALWDELDDIGRRTVLLHELAHLKRRDHWVCWVEMVACTLYWWNPMAWWVRHRLRDEADFCCDAWVTAVLPQSRTAYARALVATRQFLSLNPSRTEAPAPPALALGATSARSKRFARRLTMVMTDRSTPRISACGSALALCLVAGAWLATPLWACPPEEQSSASTAAIAAAKDKAVKTKSARAPKDTKDSVQVPHVVAAPSVSSGQSTASSSESGSTYEQHMAARGLGSGTTLAQAAPRAGGSVSTSVARSAGGDGMESRIDRLEARMDRLTAQLEQLLGGNGGAAVAAPRASGRGMSPAQPAPAAVPAPPSPPAQTAPPVRSGRGGGVEVQPEAPSGGIARNMAPGAVGVGGGAIALGDVISEDGDQIVMFYELPGDKAEALFEFMRRDDIPVLVASRGNGIEVHGNAQQQRVFAAFIKLINPDSKSQSMSSPSGMLLEREAMMRDAKLRAAQDGQRAATEGRLQEARAQVERARAQAQRQQRQQADQARRQLEQQRKQIEEQREQMQKQVEELQRKAQDMQRKAEELQKKADEMNDGAEKDQLTAQADAIEAQADVLEAQADAMQEQFEAQVEAIEEQLEAQADAMESQLEAQQDALESQLEAEQEALEAALAAAAEKVPEAIEAPTPAGAPTMPSPR